MLSRPLGRRLRCEAGAPIANLDVAARAAPPLSNPPTKPPTLCEGDLWGDKHLKRANYSGSSSCCCLPHPLPTLAREGKGFPTLRPPRRERERFEREDLALKNLSGQPLSRRDRVHYFLLP